LGKINPNTDTRTTNHLMHWLTVILNPSYWPFNHAKYNRRNVSRNVCSTLISMWKVAVLNFRMYKFWTQVFNHK